MKELIARVPYIEFPSYEVDVSVEAFLEYWHDISHYSEKSGSHPTQNDYDKWAKATVLGWLEWRRGELADCIKLRAPGGT